MVQVVITSVTAAVDEKRCESSTNISLAEEEEQEKKGVDRASVVTCASCSHCGGRGGERERYISRVPVA